MRLGLPCIFIALMVITLPLTSSSAQTGTYKVLHNFTGGSDGAYPNTGLALDRTGNVFGMTVEGGLNTECGGSGCGNAFELSQLSGHWGERVLQEFSSTEGLPDPLGSVVIDAKGNVYWADVDGGDPSCNCGAVYQLTKTGGVWTQNSLHNFDGGSGDGQNPNAGLIFDKLGNLYGSTQNQSGEGSGIIFQLSPNPDGTWAYNVIHNFGFAGDGAFPVGPLAIDLSGSLYGTTSSGGTFGNGMVFRLLLSNGIWTEENLYNFTLDFGLYQQPDGLVVDATGHLYGAAISGGEFGLGTIYELTSTSVGYWNRTILHTFTGNNDGAYPIGGLSLDRSGAIYGTTQLGGINGFGTVYKLAQGNNGQWNEHALHSFRGTDGSQAVLGVTLDQSGNVYGVTNAGGTYGRGVAFEIAQ